jgi:hypothetical protein
MNWKPALANAMRKLPIGIQDFEYLRTNNFLYVDKTQYVYHLVHYGKPYFLGRPRRFGKSLFLSTLKAYFEGKKELFEGLKIAELEKEWTQYPVFYLDFNVGLLIRAENVAERIIIKLKELERLWGQITNTEDLASRFEAIIKSAYEQTGKPVVVLIDEYDKPLINTMDDKIANEEIRTLLKSFYGVLKSADAYLRFVFLTGVTKFSKVSVFSDLNQLNDISLDEYFAEICGISETELLQNFQPEIQALAARRKMSYDEAFSELKKRYDGYHFAKESEDIYNPFSLLNTFSKLDFAYYWFATGTPTFLVKHLANTGFDIPILENNVSIAENSLMDYRVENDDYVPLLYQTGYLTIKEYDSELKEYTLGFPNEEVKYGFLNELLPQFTPSFGTSSSKFSATGFIKLMRVGDIDGTMKMLQAYFATIEYDKIPQKLHREDFYQFVFWQLFTLMGQFVQIEVKNNKGRADAVVKTANSIYVFEFKMDDNATAEDALAQINSKDYAIPYTADHRKLVKLGVEFSLTEKGVKRWLIE